MAHIATHSPTVHHSKLPCIGLSTKPPTPPRTEILTLSCDQKHASTLLTLFLQHPITFPTGIFLPIANEKSNAAMFTKSIQQHHAFLASTTQFRVAAGLHPDVMHSPVPGHPTAITINALLQLIKPPSPPVISFIDEGRSNSGYWFFTTSTTEVVQAIKFVTHVMTSIAPETPHFLYHQTQPFYYFQYLATILIKQVP